MSKQTPFFKFDAMEWLGGSIQFCTLAEKGLFIDLCAMYWDSQKPIKIDAKFKVRCRYVEGTLSDLIGTLSDLEIIQHSEAGITIPFLDILMSDREKWLEKCSEGGKKSASVKGTSSNKKEERRKKKVESREKITEYTPQFSELWRVYEMKGSKKVAFEKYSKLSEEDKQRALDAIPSYFVEKPEKQYRKDLERYITQREFDGVLERAESGQLNIPLESMSELDRAFLEFNRNKAK